MDETPKPRNALPSSVKGESSWYQFIIIPLPTILTDTLAKYPAPINLMMLLPIGFLERDTGKTITIHTMEERICHQLQSLFFVAVSLSLSNLTACQPQAVPQPVPALPLTRDA